MNFPFEEVKSIVAHELGHFFGLIHTFNGGCKDNNTTDECFGDQISTTPFHDDEIPNFTPADCNTTFFTCNNEVYPLNNFMHNYRWCFKTFVPEQFDRMGMFLNSDYTNMFSPANLSWTLEQGNQPADFAGNVTISNNISGGSRSVSANSTLTINGNITFENVDFVMGTNSKIVVPDGNSLTLRSGTTFEASCLSMWEGIHVLGSASISTSGSTKLNDAYTGIYIESDGILSCQNTQFINCYVGLQIGEGVLSPPIQNSPTITSFRGNKFLSNRVLYKKQGNNNLNLERTLAGVLGINNNYLSFIGNTNTNDFNNVTIGYFLVGNHFEITSSTFKECGTGILSLNSRGQNKIAKVNANNFESVDNCISLYSAWPFITDNNFGLENKIGIKLRNVSGPSFLWLNITNNICENFMETKALDIGNATGLYIVNNTLLSTNTNEAIKNSIVNSSDVTFFNNILTPINIINCENTLVEENSFDLLDEVSNVFGGSNNTFKCNFFTSVYAEASSRATYSCNEFDTDLETDLEFMNNNMMSSLLANTFRSADVGLLLSGDGDTQISRQEDNGNLWKGNFSDKGAKTEGFVDPLLSRFIVRNVNQELPTHQPASFFLANSSNDPESCIGPNECIDGEPGAGLTPPWIGEEHGVNCIDSLFNGNQFSNLTPEGKWVALYILVKLQLHNENPPAQLSDCFQEIKDMYEDSDEDKLIRAIKLIENRNLDFTSLPLHNIYAAIQTNSTNQAQETFDIANLNTIKGYMADIEIWNQANINTTNQNQALAVSILNSISSNEPGILHLLDVLPIYIKWINNESLSNSEQTTISNVANTCSSVGSFAKYIAMGIDASLGNDVIKEDKIACSSRTRNNRADNTLDREISIYPNPSNGIYNVIVTESTQVELTDRFGNVIYKRNFVKGANTLDLENSLTGIYFLKMISKSGKITTKKLLKL